MQKPMKRKNQLMGFLGTYGVVTSELKNFHEAVVIASQLFDVKREDPDVMTAKIKAMGLAKRRELALKNFDSLPDRLKTKSDRMDNLKVANTRIGRDAAKAVGWVWRGSLRKVEHIRREEPGTFGAASPVRRIDPKTGEIIEN